MAGGNGGVFQICILMNIHRLYISNESEGITHVPRGLLGIKKTWNSLLFDLSWLLFLIKKNTSKQNYLQKKVNVFSFVNKNQIHI